ncbi:outer membrane autotransporter [Tothia fuscella]|uniref:Outer membrane autotransporter n=1 Tax=Tothia fuscella TaxID=1048955 RepID=A0A9P4NKN1_9PEZI|nr:outer membrane autotransporter [Tothia fuscella]
MAILQKFLVAALLVTVNANPAPSPPVFQTQCNNKVYKYDELAGYGFLPSNGRDKTGDTLGGIGSSAAIDPKSWKKKGNSFSGILYGLPDRGWNTNGTINYIPRVQKFAIKFTPNCDATVANPSKPNIELTYLDTILLKGPDGTPATGLDPDFTEAATYPGFPPLPVATYPGDGFGGAGPGGKAVSLDSEGLVLTDDGFYISDEYGPYVYQFDFSGKMLGAIRPPDAILPLRNGTVSFSANSPPRYNPAKAPRPGNPTQGRSNNQGFEGLTADPKGENLYVLLQSAARQEGGAEAETRRYTRLLQYKLDKKKSPTYVAEYVVPLPIIANGTKVAAQSELHYISDTQFLILSRDSGAGTATASSTSVYRHVDVFDISKATNVKGSSYDAFNTSIASSAGVLKPGISAVDYCSFVDFNINSQLNRFGLHNGGAQDAGLLNEKWESLSLVETGEHGSKNEYYLFSLSDNDFITQNGFINSGKVAYADASGFNANNQILAFKITLPKGSRPLLG